MTARLDTADVLATAGGETSTGARTRTPGRGRLLALYPVLVLAGAALGSAGVELATAPPAPARQGAPAASDAAAVLARQLAGTALQALDHANRTGDFGVLLAFASRDFRAVNSAEGLARAFANVRALGLDLARAELARAEPVAGEPTDPRWTRLRAVAVAAAHDVHMTLAFVHEAGTWRLAEIGIDAKPAPR